MKTLFDTTTFGKRTLKNRVWRSATWMALADAEGNVTDAVHKHGALVMMQTAIVDGPIDELSTEQVEDIVRQSLASPYP
ncbi:MAG: hypothetical protein IJ064_08080 [Bacteroidaceae bacterium]|nr:hypothetical protein [Bacteroidaceae bacterium]